MSFLTDLLLKIILFECCEANKTLKFLNILFFIEKFSENVNVGSQETTENF